MHTPWDKLKYKAEMTRFKRDTARNERDWLGCAYFNGELEIEDSYNGEVGDEVYVPDMWQDRI